MSLVRIVQYIGRAPHLAIILGQRYLPTVIVFGLVAGPNLAFGQTLENDPVEVRRLVGLCEEAIETNDRLRSALIAQPVLKQRISDPDQAQLLVLCLNLSGSDYRYDPDQEKIVSMSAETRRVEEAEEEENRLREQEAEQARRANILGRSLAACMTLLERDELAALTNSHCVEMFLVTGTEID